MYWLAKTFQAAGLAVMGLGFIKSFPGMMPRNLLLLAALLFIVGWIIQSFLLKK